MMTPECRAAKAAAEALAGRLSSLKEFLEETVAKREELEAKMPAAGHLAEEALLGGAGQGQAMAALEIAAELELARQRVRVIECTLSQERRSPELTGLALALRDEAEKARASLLAMWGKAEADVRAAGEDFLAKVRALGELAAAIRRHETLANVAARAYLPGQEWMEMFASGINIEAQTGVIFLDGQAAKAFAPGGLALTAAQAMKILNADTDFVIEILEGKQK